MGITIFCFGLIIGSFLGVVIDRLPRHESLVYGRSHCNECNHDLGPQDLIPVLSYCLSKGKCRYCKTKLPLRYPLLEIITAFAYLGVSISSITNMDLILNLVFVSLLICITFIDIDTFMIFDRFHVLIAFLAILRIITFNLSWTDHLIGSLIISVPYLIIATLTQGMGGGDIKLVAALGLYLGFKPMLMNFMLTSIIGGVYALTLLLTKKKSMQAQLPYGPFICIGAYIALVAYQEIIVWYLSFF
ncbi:MAG: prepilin peptidase [Erysipelothrix sp.]